MSKPLVAIVGRPNVGKSTLFNKLINRRLSIVDDTPGVTRDRIYADCEWAGKVFTLVDTGGIDLRTKDDFVKSIRDQAQIAIETAAVIVFVVDITSGPTADDDEVATMLLRSNKPVILCVNKVDTPGQPPPQFYDFYNLGFQTVVPVSAIHGQGTGDLLDEVTGSFAPYDGQIEDEDTLKVAIIGKPNAGKSSLVNKILGEERIMVSDIPGTTRDAIDSKVTRDGKDYILIDTAGMRRKSRIDDNIERYSVIRAKGAVDRADVCIVMIDATSGVTEQDTKVAGIAHESGKGVIVCVNKWDLVEKETMTLEKYKKDVENELAYMTYAPILFISAMTGQRVEKLFELIDYVHMQNTMRISTGMLNDVISEATSKVQPPTDRGRRLKILYATQVSTGPPTFVIFVNKAKLFHFSYRRYIENQLRSVFGFEGTPIHFIIREREEGKTK